MSVISMRIVDYGLVVGANQIALLKDAARDIPIAGDFMADYLLQITILFTSVLMFVVRYLVFKHITFREKEIAIASEGDERSRISDHPNVPESPPVFIAGCGRSGTSYLRTVVAAHPDVFIPSESLFISDYLKFRNCVPHFILRRLLFREPQLLCWYEGDSFNFNSVHEAVRRLHEIQAEREGAIIWGQKTPRFVRHLDMFNSSFPGMKWILIHRDPRGVYASMLRSGQHTYSVKRACRRWLRDNSIIIDLLEGKRNCENVLVLSFSELVLDFESTLTRIFEFLSLEPISKEEVNRLGKPVFFKRSRFRINTVRGSLEPDPSIIHSWKKYLSKREIGYIESRCAREMGILGYRTSLKKEEEKKGLLPDFKGLLDLTIPFRYLIRWPEYLFFSAFRFSLFRLFSLFHRVSQNRLKKGEDGQ
jgi:hypothetical protein